ncbi:MAG TPA: acyltransferase [Terracidiphilus sp.]|nr:acyltransferase [Terracidiphilus sp.]
MKRIPQLDGIRAVAILAVFFHHSLHIKLLWAGVDLFFILSGFLITNVLLDAKHHSLGGYFEHFYSRRARRILAPYLLTLFIASFFVGLAWMRHWYFYLLFTNFLQPLGIQLPRAFEPLWSLAVEEQFYLVWPFAVYFLSERHLRRLCVALILAAPILRGSFHFASQWPVYMLTPFRMDLLAAGGLLCLIWRNDREWLVRNSGRIFAPLFAAGLCALGLLAHFHISTSDNTRTGNVLIYEATLLACLGFIVYALAGHRVAWLCWHPLRYIGRISYTMYLVHLGVLTHLESHIYGRFVRSAIALAITVAYASASWFLMERRLLHHKPAAAQPKPA